jgi:hypothetical protein
MNSESVVAYVSLALAIGGIVVGAVNHKKLRSRCCGAEKVLSLDIDNTTPKGDKAEAVEVVPRRSERLKEKEVAKESVPSAE